MPDNQSGREITWAGGTHAFDLTHPWVWNVLSIRGIPGPNGSTPAACLARFQDGTYSLDDCERVVELGLIGGGATRPEATTLLNAHVRGKPIATNAMLAISVLTALFVGTENASA